MNLLHTSDWHFGMTLGTGSYAEDQRFFLEQLYQLIRVEEIEALLLSGDIYDSSVVSAEAIGLYNEAMTKLCLELGIPRKAFFRYFSDKDGALQSLVDHAIMDFDASAMTARALLERFNSGHAKNISNFANSAYDAAYQRAGHGRCISR